MPDPQALSWNSSGLSAVIGVTGARPPDRLKLGVDAQPWTQAPFILRPGTSVLLLRPVDDPSRAIEAHFGQDAYTIAQRSPDVYYPSITGELEMSLPALAANMYALDMSRFSPHVTDADGYGVRLGGPFPSLLYEPRAPLVVPSLRRGQRFVEFNQPESNAHPAPLPEPLQIVTLRDIRYKGGAGDRVTFDPDFGEAYTETKAGDVTSVSGFTPIVEDAGVKSLDAQYGGHDVYALGSLAPACVLADGSETGLALDGTTALHVQRIERLYGVVARLGLGPWIDRTLDTSAAYMSVDPILVIFDGASDGDTPARPPFAGHGCVGGYVEFSDRWDFERALSLRSPLLSHPEWTADMRKAVSQGTVLIGMTYDMVVASVGYPSVYGTAAQMRKLDVWEYVQPTPSSFTVKFKNGKVAAYDPPRMLP